MKYNEIRFRFLSREKNGAPIHVAMWVNLENMLKRKKLDFPDSAMGKNLPANAGDTGSVVLPRKISYTARRN